MIMSGRKDAVLHNIQLIDIHGTRFYDIVFAHTDTPEQARRARIGVDDAYPDPQPGDAISVSYLMNVVTAIARR
ncbi:hypothetical protein [Roseiflexus sp.]|uniref:hypothetical protein n=1 Tax=Roseiflexus sp. TaxID=2562120 RepID=UPI00398AAF8A